MHCDAVIFGGGVAGLWILDELRCGGRSAVLLESKALGSGQTIASQGIIHGGLKYTLSGMLTRSAANISEMPLIWRDCFGGKAQPDLSATTMRSQFCYLWRTHTLTSRLGMIGAKFGLRVAPEKLSKQDTPGILRGCPGTVARLDEQVMSPPSLIANLFERNREAILKYDSDTGCHLQIANAKQIRRVTISRDGSDELVLEPDSVVFAAGRGNAGLRERAGLPASAMQLRPLHMVLVRGNLPELNGHCVDGSKTRVTITTDRDVQGRTIWQVGGEVSEVGVNMERDELIAHVRKELSDALPALDQESLEWGTYRVDRAEQQMPGNKRPESFCVLHEGNTLTVWPTKLVLAPVVAEAVAGKVPSQRQLSESECETLAEWPRPPIALPPWEIVGNWQMVSPLRKSA